MARYFTKDHEWLEVAGDIATVGITNHAQEQLGDVVFVELPEPGTEDLIEMTATSRQMVKDSLDSLVNEDAESAAWFFKLELKDKSELDGLMDAEAYEAFLQTIE